MVDVPSVSLNLQPVSIQEPKAQKPTKVGPVKLAFERLNQTFARHSEGSGKKIKNAELIILQSKALLSASYSFLDVFLSSVRSTAELVQSFLETSGKLIKSLRVTKFFLGLGVPFTIYGMIKDGKVLQKGDKEEKVLAGLSLITNVVALTDTTCEIAEALHVVGAVAESAIAWTTPLMGVSAALSLAAAAGHSIQLHYTLKASKELEIMLGAPQKNKEYSNEGYESLIRLLVSKKERYLNKHFHVDGGKLKSRLEKVWSDADKKLHPNASPEKMAEARASLKDTVRVLRGRITSNKWSHALAIVATLVSAIGVAVLLFTPIAPLAYAMLALGSGILLTRFISDQVAENRFEKHFGFDKKAS